MYSASSASNSTASIASVAGAVMHQTVCTTSFGPVTENSGAAPRRCASSSRNAAFARYASSTGPVCAFSVAMLRTRSFSLSGRVSSWRRIRLPRRPHRSRERDAGLRAPVHDHPVDVERRLGRRARARRRRAGARGSGRRARTPRRSTASCPPASRSRAARCAGSSAGRSAASARASSVLTTS